MKKCPETVRRQTSNTRVNWGYRDRYDVRRTQWILRILMAVYASFARRMPINCQQASGGKKLR